MREFVMDTETTGFDPETGDRLCEIACVELANYIPTGRVYHQYINPERDMPDDAFRVHGLSTEFLRDQPVFTEVVQEFLDFVGDGLMIFHNASFDMKFINAELKMVGIDTVPPDRVFDTLALARRKHPAGPNSLDALCKRYGIDNSARTKHGALLDAELLAEVYLQLIGGPQAALDLSARGNSSGRGRGAKAKPLTRAQKLTSPLTEDELKAHDDFIAELGDESVWRQYH